MESNQESISTNFLLPVEAESVLRELKKEGGELVKEGDDEVFDIYGHIKPEFEKDSGGKFLFCKQGGNVERFYCVTDDVFLKKHEDVLLKTKQSDDKISLEMIRDLTKEVEKIDFSEIIKLSQNELVEKINEKLDYNIYISDSQIGNYAIRAQKIDDKCFDINFGSLAFYSNRIELIIKKYLLAIICDQRGIFNNDPDRFIYCLLPIWQYYDVKKAYELLMNY